jgi:hypothetical protein
MDPLLSWLRSHAPIVTLLAISSVFLFRFIDREHSSQSGDGHYSWVYARSLIFDHDVDFTNDYEICGDPHNLRRDSSAGKPPNIFYIGPALVWAPLLAAIRTVVPLPADAPAAEKNGCTGPWLRWTLVSTPLAAVGALLFGFLVARRWCKPLVCCLAMLICAFGSTLVHYASEVPAYSHAWGAFAVALSLWAWIRAREVPSGWRWLALGLSIGAAGLMRPTHLTMFLFPGVTLLSDASRSLREGRSPDRSLWIRSVALFAGFAALYWIQLYIYRSLYGRLWLTPQGTHFMQFGHSHPFLVLFAARAGLLYWTPLMWLGFLGLIPLVRRPDHRWLALPVACWIALEIYLNAAAMDWYGGWTYGQRRLTSLVGPFVLTTAVLIDRIGSWVTLKPSRVAAALTAGWVAPAVAIGLGASNAFTAGLVPGDAPTQAPSLYSGAFQSALQQVYSRIGNPFTAPAGLVFAMRYGLAPRKLDAVAVEGYLVHNHRLEVVGPDTLTFATINEDWIAEEMRITPAGAVLAAQARGRFLSPLAWPHITHLKLQGTPTTGGPAVLRIWSGSFFFRRDVGQVTIPDGGGAVELAVPAGAFDSGINEIIVQSDREVTLSTLTWIDRTPRTFAVY